MAKRIALAMAAFAAVLGTAGIAEAHVTVWPRESTAGAFEVYTVRVPTEKGVPATRVRVEFPAGVVVSRFQPKAGWTRQAEKDSAGTLVAVIWTGGQVSTDEFEEFKFQARNPGQPGKIAWKAYQTYQDGEVVEWTGPEGSDRPASVTEVKAAPAVGGTGGASTDDHDEGPSARDAAPGTSSALAGQATTAQAGTPGGSGTSGPSGGSDLSLFTSLGALIVGVIALALSGVALLRQPRTA